MFLISTRCVGFLPIVALLLGVPAIGVEPTTWTVDEKLDVAPKDLISAGSVTQTQRGWKIYSGDWQHVDGALRGAMKPDDKRGSQLVCVMPCDDAVVEFEVRLEGCRLAQFRFQDAVPEHICRVLIRPDGFSVQKDDHDHGGPDVHVPLGRAELKLDDREWKKVRVELKGPQIRVTIDGKTVTDEHALIAAPKHFFEFIVSGSAASFRNVRARAVPREPK